MEEIVQGKLYHSAGFTVLHITNWEPPIRFIIWNSFQSDKKTVKVLSRDHNLLQKIKIKK